MKRPITLFNSTTQTTVLSENKMRIEWSEFVDMLSFPRLSETKDGGHLFVGAEFVTDGKRRAEDIICISHLVLDYDSGIHPHYWQQFHDDLDYVLYTSFSHSLEKPKFRVVLPLSKRLTVEQYRALKTPLTQYFCSGMDPASFSVSQAFYLPQVHPDRQHEFYTVHNTGKVFDVESEMDSHKRLHKLREQLKVMKSTIRGEEKQVSLNEAIAAIDEIDPDLPYKGWLDIGMFLKGHFGDAGENVYKLWTDGCVDNDHIYRIHQLEQRYNRYRDDDFRITMGSVIFWQREHPRGF